MFYNRALALEFAQDFWNRPCKSDNHPAALGLDSARDVPLSSVWNQRLAPAASFEPLFVFNNTTGRENLVAQPKPGARAKDGSALSPVVIVEGKKLEDCAHFLSRCLIAGGLAIKEQWSVPMLLIALRESENHRPLPIAKTLVEKASRSVAQGVINAGLFHIGDMIGYSDEKSAFAHSAMFTGVRDQAGRVTCHTKSRFVGLTPPQVSDLWHLDSSFKFTLIHISRHHPPQLAKTMAGWWKVAQPGKTEFIFVAPDGRTVRTTKQPTSAKAPALPAPFEGRGYWFSDQTEAKFCWQSDGRIVRITPNGDKTSAKVAVDGEGSGVAVHLWP